MRKGLYCTIPFAFLVVSMGMGLAQEPAKGAGVYGSQTVVFWRDVGGR